MRMKTVLLTLMLCNGIAYGEHSVNDSQAKGLMVPEKLQTIPLLGIELSAELEEENRVELSWINRNEASIVLYQLERSLDGMIYSIVAEKVVGDYAYDNIYEVIDNQPEPGINYYRIKVIDYDGRVEYSNVAVIKNSEFHEVVLFPNPCTEKGFYLTVDDSFDELVTVRVFALRGRLLFKKEWNAKFEKTCFIDTSTGIIKGFYHVIITSEDKRINKRIFVD